MPFALRWLTVQAGATTSFMTAATVTDQFGSKTWTTAPKLSWSVSAGLIHQSGNFTAPDLCQPCQVAVARGVASFGEAVAITGVPYNGACQGDSPLEPLYVQALGSPAAQSSLLGTASSTSERQSHLNQLNPQTVIIPALNWNPWSSPAFARAPAPGHVGGCA